LRRLISASPPMRGTAVLPAPPGSVGPRTDHTPAQPWQPRERDAARAAGDGADTRSGVEVERRFIVKEVPPELDRFPSQRISQGYPAVGEGGLEVRLRSRGENTTLTAKKGLGRTRREEEVALGAEQFLRLWPLTEGRRV